MKCSETYAERRAHKRFGNVVKVIVAAAAVAFACTAQAASYTLTLKSTSNKRGTVSGGGKYESGTKVTIKAKKNSGYAFAGWFKNKSCTTALNPKGYDNRKATVKMSMPGKDTKVYAKFVTKSEAKKSLKFSSSTQKLATTAKKVAAGEDFSLKLGISSDTLPTVTAKGLPNGLSIDKTTGKITGVPAKLGSYTATVTVKDAAGNKISQKVKINVVMPDWAKGTFNGFAYIDGDGAQPSLLQFTVGSTGGISGKVAYRGKPYSFTSSCSTFSENETSFKPTFVLGSKTYKPGTVKLCVVTELAAENLVIVEAFNDDETFRAQKQLGYIRAGGKLAGANGHVFTFTAATANSGLSSGDTLTIGLKNDVAWVKDGSTVGGVALSVTTLPMFLWNPALGYPKTYYYQVFIVDDKVNYGKRLFVTVKLNSKGAVKSVSGEFLDELP